MYLGAHLNIPYVFGLFFSLSYKKLGHAAVVKASRDVSSLTKAKIKAKRLEVENRDAGVF